MYEARRYLLGLDSSGVCVSISTSSSSSSSSSSPPSALTPTLSCPVGIDILTSAGLGLTSLGKRDPYRVDYNMVIY